MDGNIVIGVELEEKSFLSALRRLQSTAAQTTSRLLEPMGKAAGTQFLAGLRSADAASAGRTLARQTLGGFSGENFTGAGYGAAAGLLSGFRSGGSGMRGSASGMAAAVRNAFSGNWYSVGCNISAGIAAGIRGGSSAVTAAAAAAAYSALYAAKRALGIRSPSRVFRDEVGRNISSGIAEGITAGQRTVQTAMERQSELLVAAARQDVTPTLPRLGGTASRESSGGTGGGPLQISLEAPLYLDGRELARATAKYTGRQMMWEAM